MSKNFGFNEDNNSIATILRKVKLSDNLYLFKYDSTEIGHIDKDTGNFVTIESKEFNNINYLKESDYKVFSTYLEKDDLDLVFGYDESIDTKLLISRYIDYVKSFMFLVKVKKKNNKITNVSIKDVDIEQLTNSFVDNSVNSIFSDDYSVINEILFDDKRIEKFIDSDVVEKLSISNDITKLIEDVYNCEFNSKELFKIAENISYLKDYFQSALDTIELQLHAYYNCDKAPLHPDSSDFDFINSSYDPYSDLIEEKEDKSNDYDNFEVKKRMNLVKLRDEIKKHLINQDEALRRVLVEIARMDIKDNEKNKGILLLGESGTGKTYLMELLAKNLGVPFLIVDSTQLTIPGYVGKDIQEYLWDLYEDCDRDLEKCENAIVFFDEIDKKGSNRKSDTSGQGVLNVLLKFLDGTTYDACRDTKHSTEIVKINTSKMKIIAGGAFSDVFGEQNKKHSVGFLTEEAKEEKNSIPDVDTFVQKAFMTPEFMGRFPIRIKLNSHSVESFSTILKESESSTLKEEERTFNKLGVKLKVTPEFISAASSEALKLKTGVRGLMGTIEESTWVAFEDVYNNPNKYEEIVLTEDTLKDPNNYQKVLKKQV